jgi:ADP-dependent NAD(P)H-hydrate dehydratase / NAD(P)H-hydrate epimerase
MSYVVTPDQMREAEQHAIDAGRSEAELMVAAAAGIAEWVDVNVSGYGHKRAAFGLVGPGKNGGDTLLALGLLIELGWSASAYLIGRDDIAEFTQSDSSIDQIAIVTDLSPVDDSHVILDGVYGTGGHPDLPEHVAGLMSDISRLSRMNEVMVVAVDVPSGVDSLTGEASEATLQADITLTIGFFKIGLLNEPAATLAGEIEVIDIGLVIPDDENRISIITRDSVTDLLPRRQATSGKHDHGGLLVIGGAPTYFGAPRLVAEAALRVGTGLVGAAVPRMLISTIAVQVPEVVFVPLSDSDPRRSVTDLNEALAGENARYTAAVLGPGLGRDEPAKALLSRLFGQATTSTAAPIGFGSVRNEEETPRPEESALASAPLVLDADALNWLSDQDDWPALLENISAVLTPHAGEMARLLGTSIEHVKSDPRTHARNAAQEWGQVVVLKGGFTAAAAPDGRVALAHRATPELATPGTGDVLGGIIGGFLAQGVEPFDAACLAIYVGSEAGRIARFGLSTRSVLARDLIRDLASVLNELEGSRWWA